MIDESFNVKKVNQNQTKYCSKTRPKKTDHFSAKNK